MLARLRKADDKRDEGFTLIELLVVIIIIGILAAIAIPTFLNQRQKGYKADMKSAAKNAATALESAATDTNGDYSGFNGWDEDDLAAEGFKKSSTISVSVAATADDYCITVLDSRISDTTYYYASDVGAPEEDTGTGACA